MELQKELENLKTLINKDNTKLKEIKDCVETICKNVSKKSVKEYFILF